MQHKPHTTPKKNDTAHGLSDAEIGAALDRLALRNPHAYRQLADWVHEGLRLLPPSRQERGGLHG